MTESTVRRRAPGMTPEERRAMIVRSALPLVAEFGGAVTTAQVARAAGIGEATVFRAFADKDALLKACIAEALNPENMLRELHSIPLEEPLADRLLEAVEALDAYLGRMGAVMGAVHASGMPHRRPPRDRADAGSVDAGTVIAGSDDAGLVDAGTDHVGTDHVGTLDTGPGGAGSGDAGPGGAGGPLGLGGMPPRPVGREVPGFVGGASGREASRRAMLAAVTELMEPDRDGLRVTAEQAAAVFLQMQFGRPPVLEIADRRVMVDLFLHGALRRSGDEPAAASARP